MVMDQYAVIPDGMILILLTCHQSETSMALRPITSREITNHRPAWHCDQSQAVSSPITDQHGTATNHKP